MKKNLLALIVALAAIAAVFAVRFVTPEDAWVCVNGQWAKHGSPSIPRPEAGCSEGLARSLVVDFEMTGHLVKDNPGLKPGVWYLVSEKPGNPALYKELVFDVSSVYVQ